MNPVVVMLHTGRIVVRPTPIGVSLTVEWEEEAPGKEPTQQEFELTRAQATLLSVALGLAGRPR